MPDNNPTLRSTLARLAGGIFNFQFTDTFETCGFVVQAMGTQLSESDQLLVAGREIHRAKSGMVQASQINGAVVKLGAKVIYSGDPNWILEKFLLSDDGAVYTFLIIDGR